jgi:hypothetical protein
MEITYQLRKEDLLALNDDFASQSATFRRVVLRTSLTAMLTMIFVSFALWLLTGAVAPSLAVLVFGVLLAAFIPARIKRNQRKTAAALYREGKNRALFLPITLSVDCDSLSWESKAGSSNMKFEYVERVRQTPTHLFIYLSARNAQIVPREGIISGDFDSFAWEVQRRWKNAMDLIAEPHELHSV